MIHFNIYNPNSRSTTSIEIYREDSGIDIPDNPTKPPIQIHDGFVTSILDTNVVIGNSYNYRVKLIQTGNKSVMGAQFTCTASSIFGPGGYHRPIAQSVNSAYLGIVDESEGLPTSQDLLNLYGGSRSSVYNWSGKWVKFKHGDSIYYTPYHGFIFLVHDIKDKFVNSLAPKTTIKKNNYTYGLRYDDSVINTLLNVSDGCYTTKYPLPCENPGYNLCTAASLAINEDTYYIYVVIRVEPSDMKTTYLRHGPYGVRGFTEKFYGNINGVTSGSKFTWKPVIKLLSTSGSA